MVSVLSICQGHATGRSLLVNHLSVLHTLSIKTCLTCTMHAASMIITYVVAILSKPRISTKHDFTGGRKNIFFLKNTKKCKFLLLSDWLLEMVMSPSVAQYTWQSIKYKKSPEMDIGLQGFERIMTICSFLVSETSSLLRQSRSQTWTLVTSLFFALFSGWCIARVF